MPIRPFALPCCALLFIGFCQQLVATDTPTDAAKPGYSVTVEVTINEQGVAENPKIVESDDNSEGRLLDHIAVLFAKEYKQAPKLKDGKPVPSKVQRPYNFPVEDDEGAAADLAPKPSAPLVQRVIFPPALAAQGVNGGAILELNVGDYGNVQSVKVLRASHPEFAEAASTAFKNWIFIPAKKNGVNVESRCRIAVRFVANEKALIDWQWTLAPRPSIGCYPVTPTSNPALDAALAPAK